MGGCWGLDKMPHSLQHIPVFMAITACKISVKIIPSKGYFKTFDGSRQQISNINLSRSMV